MQWNTASGRRRGWCSAWRAAVHRPDPAPRLAGQGTQGLAAARERRRIRAATGRSADRLSMYPYTVSLDAFHGPLDLLLHLVKRNEVDVLDIPIARIADQF